MARKLLDHRMSEPISPLIDVVVNALAAIFIILMIYMVVFRPGEKPIPPFQLAKEKFESGDFLSYPVESFANPAETSKRLDSIALEHKQIESTYPYIFVVGHANSKDDPTAVDKTEPARLERNWNFAGRRAALIAKEIQKRLTELQREKIVLVSAGEFDKQDPANPLGQENAWVEVVFGRDWKPPSHKAR
jgi:hypothetical protein